MKTLALLILISICSALNGFAQNRIHGWDREKITSVRVELTSPDDITEIQIFSKTKDIDTILTFLKSVAFKDFDAESYAPEKQIGSWKYRMIFQGQHDQVYLYKGSACIGKTTFIIDDKVIEEFRILMENIGQNK